MIELLYYDSYVANKKELRKAWFKYRCNIQINTKATGRLYLNIYNQNKSIVKETAFSTGTRL